MLKSLSASRHAGLEIANYYQEEAWKQLNGNSQADIEEKIAQLKAEGRTTEIEITHFRLNKRRFGAKNSFWTLIIVAWAYDSV
ncbi:MAG: hypothetical protein MJZ27_06020 [Bacteroidales bacterium]|nr:hypothetical protein [Bacteroidales bacterium]